MQHIYRLGMNLSVFLAAFFAIALFSGMIFSTPASAQRFMRDDRPRQEARDQAMPFSAIKRKVEAEMGDEASYVGVAPSPRDGVVRMQFLRRDGRVIWVDVDERTGNVIARTR